jgi:alpha-L-arabinofuranosidase
LRYGTKPVKWSEGGNCSGNILNGNFMRFDNIDFGPGSESIDFRAATSNSDGSLIEVRVGSIDGELLGTCKVNNTGDWQNWQTFSAKIKLTKGKKNIFLVFLNPQYPGGNTTIYAYFPSIDPNKSNTEINKRQTVFYPTENFINYITVRGFTLENAATNWAPPSSEQTAIIGTNWSKGWIIENNLIRYSKCCGVSLGKYGDGTDNTNDAGEADPYTACVKRALKNGWNKATIGSHIVRNNHIHHCEQTGIVGSMGCAFSKIYGNEIHDIHYLQLFSGAEMAGIKFHGAIDVEIKDNHIYKCGNVAGLWLDWMAQGAVVTGNLFHDNFGGCGDIFFEMQHGPIILANNLLLSPVESIAFNSKGIAIAHNFISSKIYDCNNDERNTPFHKAHSTEIAGLHNNAPSGDFRFYNNILAGPCNLNTMDISQIESYASGNVFVHGAHSSRFDKDSVVVATFNPEMKLIEKNGEWFLEYNAEVRWTKSKTQKMITTEMLGISKIPQLPYENADGTSIKISTDYFGKQRNNRTPFPGPIEITKSGKQEFKVWPKTIFNP